MFARTLVLLVLFSFQAASADKWTDSSGKYTVEAEFVGLESGTVQLKRADGETISLPLTRLSSADQQRAKRLQAAMDESPSETPASRSRPANERDELVAQIAVAAQATRSQGFHISNDGKQTPSTDIIVNVDFTGAPAADAREYGYLVIDSATLDGKRTKTKGAMAGFGGITEEFERIDRGSFLVKHPKDGVRLPLSLQGSEQPPEKVSVAGRIKLKTGGTKVDVVLEDLANLSGRVRDPELKEAGAEVEVKVTGNREVKIIVNEKRGLLETFSITDPDGKQLKADFWGSSHQSDSKKHDYHFEYSDGIPANAQIRLTLRKGAEDITVPFKFVDLPMLRSNPTLPEIIELLTGEGNMKEVTLEPVGGQENKYEGTAMYGGYKHPLKVTVDRTKVRIVAERITVEEKRRDGTVRQKTTGPWQIGLRWKPENAGEMHPSVH